MKKLGMVITAGIIFLAELLNAQSGAPDSIVQITAEAQGLLLVTPDQIPPFGTYWIVTPGGMNGVSAAPLPCPPVDPTLPIYQVAEGQYIVDGTAGQVLPSGVTLDTATASSLLSLQSAAVSDLIANIQQNQTASQLNASLSMNTMTASATAVPSPGDAGSGTYTPDASALIQPDYGTNLWIAQTAVAAGQMVGIISNSSPGVQMELQYATDPTQPWQSTNWFFSGDDTTNWTHWNVPAISSSNLFLRVRSWADSSGSGIPDWWQVQNFGTNGVDPYGNPAGDGYNNYYKFENSMDPHAFYPPAAPPGLSVSLHQTAQTATINWPPSMGAVASYTVEKAYHAPRPLLSTTNYYSTSDTTYLDSLSANQPDIYNGGGYNISYRVRAVYQNGVSGAWSQPVPLQQPTVTGGILPGPNGASTLFVQGVPASATIVRLAFIDRNALSFGNGDQSFNYTKDIPVASLGSGLYALPPDWAPPSNDAYGISDYAIYVESVDAAGNSSAPYFMPTLFGNVPFYDGRAQLKENLVFQLRAPTVNKPFSFYFPTNPVNYYPDQGDNWYYYPSNYACAGLYPFTGPKYYDNIGPNAYWLWSSYKANYGGFDLFLPFEENCLFRNFAFNVADMDANGNLTTGGGYDGFGDYEIQPSPKYLFDTNAATLPNLLSATDSRWLLPDSVYSQIGWETGIVYAYGDLFHPSLGMSGSYSNWFGLPITSAEVLFGNAPGWATLRPGDVWDELQLDSPTPYLETAQPQFNTIKYCFYQPQYDWLPGSASFSPTNDSPSLMVWNDSGYSATNDLPFILVSAGSITQVAGYAKLAVLNAAPGIFGYLGQYFDKAYQVDGYGNITTNITGYVSPYGFYFATNVGQAALVTMPDLDTGERGTCMVYSVSMQVDKNHDGTMDTSFNGPDATSQSSPMVFWVNSGDDYSSGADDPYGHDNNNPYAQNYRSPFVTCARDLENYARLWLCGLPALSNVDYQVTLSWTNMENGSPAVNLVPALETNGSTLYLTDTNIALQYADASRYGGFDGLKYPTISVTKALLLPARLFTNNNTKYFLFEGAGIGKGELMLTVSLNSNCICQTGIWLDLHDINDFYEQAHATNVTSGLPPSSLVSQNVIDNVTATAEDETKQLVVFVHGINNTIFDYHASTQTLFKRLYWSGYHGKVAGFRWPCAYLPFQNTLNPFNFDLGEYYAWKSGSAFKDYLYYLHNRSDLTNYTVNILAHSQGNIVAGEAVRQGAPFDNYILTQGAVPAHCYDTTLPFLPKFLAGETNKPTPLYTLNGGYHGYFSGITGNLINFYNTNDYALAKGTWLGLQANWEQDQVSQKPEDYSYRFGQYYIYNPSSGTTEAYYVFSQYDVIDRYEIKAMAARTRTRAIGAEDGAGGVINRTASVDLRSTFGFGNTRPEHSAQFARPIQAVLPYFQTLLNRIQPAQ